MEQMGGLIHRMPWTSALFLVACVAISALPPLNGFVSEWLIFQAALMAPSLGDSLLTTMIPFSTAMLAFAGALAATCFVKVFGVVFLGHARSEQAANAHEVDGWMKLGMAIPACCCLLLGLFPSIVISVIDQVPQLLLHTSLTAAWGEANGLWLMPVSKEHGSYASLIVLSSMLVLGGLIAAWVYMKGNLLRRSRMWSCGNPHTHARMQYNATSFAQPMFRIFKGFYASVEHESIEQHQHALLVKKVHYHVDFSDMLVKKIYHPIGAFVRWLAQLLYREHQRDIHVYMTYSFVTLLLLLLGFDLMKYMA